MQNKRILEGDYNQVEENKMYYRIREDGNLYQHNRLTVISRMPQIHTPLFPSQNFGTGTALSPPAQFMMVIDVV